MGCNVKPRYRIFCRIITEFNSLKIENFEFWITELFAHFLNSEFAVFFDENLPNLTALVQHDLIEL